jgi:multiple sugar transport system substrate-binding protein
MQSSINLSRRQFIKTIGAGLAMAGLAPAFSGPISPLASVQTGPTQRLGPANVVGVYAIWQFAKNIELAKKFAVDLILNYDTAFARSELFNFPSFPGTVADFKQRLAADPAAAPAGKYSQLENAEQWSTNFGYPGPENAAVSEVMSAYIIPKMFALAAQGGVTPQGAVLWAESRIKPIFARWHNKGLI